MCTPPRRTTHFGAFMFFRDSSARSAWYSCMKPMTTFTEIAVAITAVSK
jgi:hypothetical protein